MVGKTAFLFFYTENGVNNLLQNYSISAKYDAGRGLIYTQKETGEQALTRYTLIGRLFLIIKKQTFNAGKLKISASSGPPHQVEYKHRNKQYYYSHCLMNNTHHYRHFIQQCNYSQGILKKNNATELHKISF